MIYVCSLKLIKLTIKKTKAKYLISLINKSMMPNTPINIEYKNHLKLSFDDIIKPTDNYINVSDNDILSLINFLKKWNQKNPILFHCWYGVSRSTAGAYIAANFIKGSGFEKEIAKKLREIAPFSTPNKLIIKIADKHLKRNGKMIKAINNIGRGSSEYDIIPFMLPI